MKAESDRKVWRKTLSLSNFINSYYQYRDAEAIGNIGRILVIGPGQGLDTAVWRWRGKKVETFDVDAVMNPDHQGTVADLSRFPDSSWDLIAASHVLEHLPLAQLDTALSEMARVSRHALIYLPMAGRFSKITLAPGIRNINWQLIIDWFNPWAGVDPERPRHRGGEHYWEVGLPGFRIGDIKRRLSVHFRIIQHYRNKDWPQSYNFVLRSLAHGG